ncbi:alpha-galactosidase [Paraburkholderia sp. Tr-20389]|uniref:alpha-galactosidase n=1 Tax=Paraburkholderia sp. Tr-20389 TaxID=2703903 RepID=UPI001F11BA07|nr:alpha-galactosidase [Paraburkholderia sp. Tr-20389]
MGWSSWNSLGEGVSYDVIRTEADGLAALNTHITSGARYEYVNIDEGWWRSGQRDESGNFIVDTTQWPGGMRAIARYIHDKGLKAGIYIDAGPQGCGKRPDGTHFVGSDFAHYDHDFLQFAQWGFDFVKVDFCGGLSKNYDPETTYRAIAQAIRRAHSQTGRLMTFSLCDGGMIPTSKLFPDYGEGPWVWGAGVGTMWRTTRDITPDFGSVTYNLAGNYHPDGQHTGYYNDPDMMVAAMGMSAVHDQAHVSLWAIAGAPMILGNDLAKRLAADTARLLTNPEVLAIDQDALGLQGLLVAQSGSQQIWAKLLAGTGQRAVVLFNNSTTDAQMVVTWDALGLVPSSQASVRDVWTRKDLGRFTASYTAPDVPAGGVTMLTVSGTETAPVAWEPGPLTGTATYSRCPACQSGRKITHLGTASFRGSVSTARGGFVEIGYINDGVQTAYAQLAMNGKRPTTLAFPPTGGDDGRLGAVTVYVPYEPGSNTLALSNADPSIPAPDIGYVVTVGGPVPLASAISTAH